MKIEQNPFSLYDFFGYFIPGALLMFLLYLIPKLDYSMGFFDYIDQITIGGFEAYLPFIIISYIVGHLQSFLSSYTIERFCLWRYSYPFRFLMGFEHDGYLNFKCHSASAIFKRILLWIIVFPVSIWDTIFGKILKLNYLHNKKFSDQTKLIIKNKLSILVLKEVGAEIDVNIEDRDNFALIYHYTLEKTKNHKEKFINYVSLYGFSRSVAFILLTAFWYSLYFNLFNNNWSLINGFYLVFLSITAYLFYLNFCKFYRRYSIEVIMTFITME